MDTFIGRVFGAFGLDVKFFLVCVKVEDSMALMCLASLPGSLLPTPFVQTTGSPTPFTSTEGGGAFIISATRTWIPVAWLSGTAPRCLRGQENAPYVLRPEELERVLRLCEGNLANEHNRLLKAAVARITPAPAPEEIAQVSS